MKQIITALIFCFAFGVLNGQEKVEENDKGNRVNSILVEALVGSTKIGLGIKYKSLYKINNAMKVGWGIGLETYSSELERKFIPLSIDVLGDLNENGKTPFYMLSMGYGIPLQEVEDFASSSKGGLMVDMSIGYRSKKNTNQPFIAIGYHLQHASYEDPNVDRDKEKIVLFKRWSISVGSFF